MDRSILGKSYTDSVQAAGGLPLIIPPIIDPADLDILLSSLDGVILTGGDDLHPDYYSESSEPLTPKPFHPRRGTHDRQIFEYVWKYKIPTLAVCLGMQEVNVFLGGSLFQDIPAQIEQHLTHKIGDWFEARHNVNLAPDSLLTGLLKIEILETNSAHHQAVKTVAEHLKITGQCSDGIIEALEPNDPSIPLLAVQWHPESEINEDAGLKLFSWLISEASK